MRATHTRICGGSSMRFRGGVQPRAGAFAYRLEAIGRVLKRGGGIEPEKLLARMLQAEEIAELLGLKVGSIHNMTSRLELPAVHLGRRMVLR